MSGPITPNNWFVEKFVFNQTKLNSSKELFTRNATTLQESIDLGHISVYACDSIEGYYVDRFYSHTIPHSIIEKCFKDVESAINREDTLHLITYETKKQHFRESSFFWRVFVRAQEEQGKILLQKMQPIIAEMKESDRAKWETSISVTNTPPLGKDLKKITRSGILTGLRKPILT